MQKPMFACLVLGLAVAPALAGTEEFLLGGIQVHEPDLDHWTATLQDVGMNTVSVTVYAKHGDWDSDHLWWEDEELGIRAVSMNTTDLIVEDLKAIDAKPA